MVLQDLAVGQTVYVELIWENQTYTLNASTVGKNDSGVLIVPHPNQEDTIMVIRRNVRKLNFSVYAISDNGGRVAWKNVKVYPMAYKERTYFACGTNLFHANAESSERRNDPRIILDVLGEVAYDDGRIDCLIHDISDSGISFLVPSNVIFANTKVYISYTDIINDNDFKISEAVRIVRNVDQGTEILYGCRFLNVSNDYLTYSYLKKMEQKASIKAENKDSQGDK